MTTASSNQSGGCHAEAVPLSDAMPILGVVVARRDVARGGRKKGKKGRDRPLTVASLRRFVVELPLCLERKYGSVH